MQHMSFGISLPSQDARSSRNVIGDDTAHAMPLGNGVARIRKANNGVLEVHTFIAFDVEEGGDQWILDEKTHAKAHLIARLSEFCAPTDNPLVARLAEIAFEIRRRRSQLARPSAICQRAVDPGH